MTLQKQREVERERTRERERERERERDLQDGGKVKKKSKGGREAKRKSLITTLKDKENNTILIERMGTRERVCVCVCAGG